MKQFLAKLLFGIKQMFKSKPILFTKVMNIGQATLIIQMFDGSVITGYLRGSVQEDLLSLVDKKLEELKVEKFVRVDTQENIMVFPPANVKNITIFKSDKLVEVTYETNYGSFL